MQDPKNWISVSAIALYPCLRERERERERKGQWIMFEVDECRMEKELPESAHGPNVKYREHSMFYNPRMPAAVRDDKLTVHICQVCPLSLFGSLLRGIVSAPNWRTLLLSVFWKTLRRGLQCSNSFILLFCISGHI